MKKRLTIYVVFSEDAIVEKYVNYALAGLRNYSDKIIVVCNSPYIKSGKEYITEYADVLICRENRGLDAGAFKDLLVELYKSGEINEYDNLLLANDSWYGPLWSFEDVFSTMDRMDEYDFWSMTKHPGGTTLGVNGGDLFPAHCQSFFINFKKDVIHSQVFRSFWKDLEYPEKIEDAILKFEIGINVCLENAGFKGISYMEVKHPDRKYELNENPYIDDVLFLVSEDHIPILKRKAFIRGKKSFIGAVSTLDYIRKNTDYDVSLIENSVLTKCHGLLHGFEWRELNSFRESFKHIYIYGGGIWGRNIEAAFKYLDWDCSGIIETKRRENIRSFEEIDVTEDTGFIIAVSKKEIGEEIQGLIKTRAHESQILLPKYGLMI